jgi:hypothetical protein
VTSARADKTLYRPEPDRHEALHYGAAWLRIHPAVFRAVGIVALVVLLVVAR